MHNDRHLLSLEYCTLIGREKILPFSVLLQTLDDEPVSTGKEYQWQNRPVSEWTNQQVCHWLMGMNMDQYMPEFTAKGVDGQQLLHLDSDKLKVITAGLMLKITFGQKSSSKLLLHQKSIKCIFVDCHLVVRHH